MSGNYAGGIKATKTCKKLYGKDFYMKIGALGGQKSRGGGFEKHPRLASISGYVGGRGGWAKLPEDEANKLKAEVNRIKGYKNDYR